MEKLKKEILTKKPSINKWIQKSMVMYAKITL